MRAAGKTAFFPTASTRPNRFSAAGTTGTPHCGKCTVNPPGVPEKRGNQRESRQNERGPEPPFPVEMMFEAGASVAFLLTSLPLLALGLFLPLAFGLCFLTPRLAVSTAIL